MNISETYEDLRQKMNNMLKTYIIHQSAFLMDKIPEKHRDGANMIISLMVQELEK
jgi:ApbE superfamily uncharacterized protein (UPF0280 family)